MDDVKVHDGLFDEKTLEELTAFVKTVPWSYENWHSNKRHGFAHWNYDIVKLGNDNIASCESLLPPPVMAAWERIKTVVPVRSYPIRNYLNCHTYGVEGYPHTDSPRADEVSAVIYLTPGEWKMEWAGSLVLYKDGDAVSAITPRYGRVSIFPATMHHAATAVSRICPVPRISMALKLRCAWYDKELRGLEKFLREHKAHQIPHRRGSLMAHLVRTYEILKAGGQSLDVCLAGGLHSVYGTKHFKPVTIAERSIVQERFGYNVEDMVFEYSGIDVTSPDLSDEMKTIAAANLRDQGRLKKFPTLEQFCSL